MKRCREKPPGKAAGKSRSGEVGQAFFLRGLDPVWHEGNDLVLGGDHDLDEIRARIFDRGAQDRLDLILLLF